MNRHVSPRATWPFVFAFTVAMTGCPEDEVTRRLGDATVSFDARFDSGEGGSIGSSDSGSSDSGPRTDSGGTTSDAGTGAACTLGDPIVLATVATSVSFAPVVATIGSDTLVAWVETRLGQTDVFARRVLGDDSLGDEIQVTDDAAIETDIALAAVGSDYLLAYSSSLLGGTDLTVVDIDPAADAVVKATPITSDLEGDVAPRLFAVPGGATLVWERTESTPTAFRTSLDTTGVVTGTTTTVSATNVWTSPYATDATSGDIRLYHRLDASTLESVELGTDGLELDPDPNLVTFDFSGYALGTRIRTTAGNASPRAVLVDADDGSSQTAVLQRVSASGTTTGSVIEVDTSQSDLVAALASYASHYVVAYRSDDGSTTTLRLRAYRSNGTRSNDLDLLTLEGSSGSVELVTRATGTAMTLVLDDIASSSRELRAYTLTCTLN